MSDERSLDFAMWLAALSVAAWCRYQTNECYGYVPTTSEDYNLARAYELSLLEEGVGAMPNRVWETTGKCLRGHDITNPDNVAIRDTTSRGRRRVCRICLRERTRRNRDGTPMSAITAPILYEAKICEFCGKQYERPNKQISVQAWTQRKYCNEVCRMRARARVKNRAKVCRPLPQPLDEVTLARLRRMVNYDPDRDYQAEEREARN